jgi:two-component system, sensor histidine kinase PdtaS
VAEPSSGNYPPPTPMAAPIRLADEYFRAALEAAPTGMLLVDEHGCIALANDYILSLFGYSREELLGQRVEVLVPERFEHHAELRRGYASGGLGTAARIMGQGRDLFGRRKDGTEVPVEIGLNPMSTPDGLFVLCVVGDITERLKTTARLRKTAEEKETLLREVHHRVKNNLQIISSLLNLQLATLDDVPAAKVLRETQNRVHSIALVHDLLQLSTERAKVDLTEYLGALTSHVSGSWGSSVSLGLEVQPGLSLPLEAAVPCGLIVNELVTNSLKHAFPAGQGTISVGAARQGDDVDITVKDDGVGIPEDAPAGLGLELLATLSRQLHGTLEVIRSGGTSARLRFPSPLG